MKSVGFRASALASLALLESCYAAVAKPPTYLPYQLYDYQDLNTGSQRYWLLNPVDNAPSNAKPILFGFVNTTTSASKSAVSQPPIKIDIQFPTVNLQKNIASHRDTSQKLELTISQDISAAASPQATTITLPASAKPLFSDVELSNIVAEYAKQIAKSQRYQQQPPPPKTVPDNSPDPGLRDTFGNVGTIIGSTIGGPIGIGIGSAIGYEDPFGIVRTILGFKLDGPVGLVIGSVIGYGIGSNIGGPIGDFIGGRLGAGMAQTLQASGALVGS